MRWVSSAAIIAGAALVAGCPSDPPAPDAAWTEDDAYYWAGEDAASEDAGAADDAYACPMRAAGRWVIGPFTYSGPDCTEMSSIDLEYHPVAFTVGDDGTVTSCECDTAGDACEVSLGGYGAAPPCLIRLSGRGHSMNLYVESATTARVIDHRLAAGFGTCLGSGPFSHE